MPHAIKFLTELNGATLASVDFLLPGASPAGASRASFLPNESRDYASSPITTPNRRCPVSAHHVCRSALGGVCSTLFGNQSTLLCTQRTLTTTQRALTTEPYTERAHSRGVPMKVVVADDGAIQATYCQPLTLIRPDGHTARRGNAVDPNDFASHLDRRPRYRDLRNSLCSVSVSAIGRGISTDTAITPAAVALLYGEFARSARPAVH
ncbi:MAG: hypothetical protein WBO08_16520 [Mycobacterium sp.]